jgi:hypothetical protein
MVGAAGGRFLAACLAVGVTLPGLVGSCGDSKKKKQHFPDSQLACLKKAGLKPGTFKTAEADKYGANACVKGEIGDLSALLCRFESEAKAKEAEDKLLKFVGTAVTGVARPHGRHAIVVSDPGKKDLRGKTINKVLEAAKGCL